MNAKRIRKALVAGVGGALAALVAGAGSAAPTDEAGWVALVVGALGAGVLVGLATWRTPNATA